jgi:A/G-specific adenine glycosylase
MDYGTHLKATRPNPSRRSRHHVRQGRFEGSNRQLRGRLLAALAGAADPDGSLDASGGAGGSAAALSRSTEGLVLEVGFPAERVADALGALQAEGFVVSDGSGWRIG